MIAMIVAAIIILLTGCTVVTYCCLCVASKEDEWMEQYEQEVSRKNT